MLSRAAINSEGYVVVLLLTRTLRSARWRWECALGHVVDQLGHHQAHLRAKAVVKAAAAAKGQEEGSGVGQDVCGHASTYFCGGSLGGSPPRSAKA